MPDPEETEREALADLIEATSTEWEADFKAEGIRIGNHADFVANRLIASGFRRLSESEIRRDQAEKDAGIAEEVESEALDRREDSDYPDSHVGQHYDGEALGAQRAAKKIRAQFTPSPETEQENTR